MAAKQSLAGKVAIISGSSSGIGAATAQELAERGAYIVVNYPFPSQREEAEKVLKSLATKNSIIVEADLSTTDGPTKLVAASVASFGTVDILVNNAARQINVPLEETTAVNFEDVVNLNCRGPLLLTQAVLKHLSKGNSRIINVCSASAREPQSGMSIYSGSKGMLETFTRVWARELPRKYGCTVNSVAPGPVNTEEMKKASPALKESLVPILQQTPVGERMAEPEEIAWSIAMLCENKASWINGSYLVVGGGTYMS